MTVDLQLVVIGAGRSGTAWAAVHLTNQGLTCGHESVFDWHPSSQPTRRLDYPGRVTPNYEPPAGLPLRAESSLAAIAYLDQLPPHVRVWHLARDPLACVASWASSGILDNDHTPYGLFAHRHVPQLDREDTSVGRAACWVANWNLLGHARCAGRDYRLSRLEDEHAAPLNRHRSDPRPISWDDVLALCTGRTAARLAEWATLAGYPHPAVESSCG